MPGPGWLAVRLLAGVALGWLIAAFYSASTRKRALTEARGDLARRQEAIQGVVAPLQEALRRYEEQIQQLESRRDKDYGDLSRHLRDLTATQQQLQQETANLVTALRNPRVRERWGEVILRRVVVDAKVPLEAYLSSW